MLLQLPEGWRPTEDGVFCPRHESAATRERFSEIKNRRAQAWKRASTDHWCRLYYKDIGFLLDIIRCQEGYGNGTT